MTAPKSKRPPSHSESAAEPGEDFPPQVQEDESAYHQQVFDQLTRKRKPELAKQLTELRARLKRKSK